MSDGNKHDDIGSGNANTNYNDNSNDASSNNGGDNNSNNSNDDSSNSRNRHSDVVWLDTSSESGNAETQEYEIIRAGFRAIKAKLDSMHGHFLLEENQRY